MAPTGLILPGKVAADRARAARRPKAMDFFAGAGGMSLGLIQAGYEVVAAAEYDCGAVVTYGLNLCRYRQFTMHFVTPEDGVWMERFLTKQFNQAGVTVTDGAVKVDGKRLGLAGTGLISGDPAMSGVSHVFVGNVRKLTSERILETLGMNAGELDVVCGGPPCQGFSKGGKQNVYDPRNGLVYEFARFIVELQPKAMIMEEVPEVATMMDPDGVPVLDKLRRILEDGDFRGYEAFRKMAHGGPDRVEVMRGATPKRLAAEAKRERKAAARAAKAKAARPHGLPGQIDLFGEAA
ncbi:DNA cytosine methyltransferase [Methylobacterium ajmalii]|uniref:DNA cytosine methyltransferase n=2 Tax=Methylobacterium ajmalii TaxID=2738439 RepID=UPI002FEE1876